MGCWRATVGATTSEVLFESRSRRNLFGITPTGVTPRHPFES
jgi:hypothetical protein